MIAKSGKYLAPFSLLRALQSGLRKTMSRQFRVNMVSGTVCAALNAVVALLAYALYLRYLGYEGLGLWLVLSTVLTVSQFGNLGISAGVTAIVASRAAAGDWEGVRTCTSTAVALVATTGTVMLMAALSFRIQFLNLFHLTSGQLGQANRSWLIVAMLSCCVYLTDSFQAAVSGLGRQDLCNYNQLLTQTATLLCSFLLLRGGFGIKSLVYGSCVGYLISGAFLFLSFRQITGSVIFAWAHVRSSQVAPLLRLGGWMLGWSALNLLFGPLNRVMLARFCGVSLIPVYDVALSTAMRLRSLFETAIRGVTAEVGRGTADRTNGYQASTLTKESRRLLILASLPPYIGVVLLATPMLRVWLHGNVNAALPIAFRMLLIATFISLVGTPSHYAFVGLGKTRTCFIAGAMQAGTSAAVVTISALVSGSTSVATVCLGTIVGMSASTGYLLWRDTANERGHKRAGATNQSLAVAN